MTELGQDYVVKKQAEFACNCTRLLQLIRVAMKSWLAD